MKAIKEELKQKLQHIQKNLFIGRHSVFIVAGFAIGSTLMARSLWQYFYENVGLFWTTIIGLFIFILSGVYMHKFYDMDKYINNNNNDELI